MHPSHLSMETFILESGKTIRSMVCGYYNSSSSHYSCCCCCCCVCVCVCAVGKGTQVWKGSGDIYDGDWQEGMRHGFGTLSVRDDTNSEYIIKKYSGGWINDKRHVSIVFSID